MARNKDARRASTLKRSLKEQGRSVAWLAEETGYSRGYVSNILHGNVPWSEEFQRRALEALKTSGLVPVTYRGRAIQIPEDIHAKASELPLIVVESAYEEAWKRAWLQENAQSALAIAADRAWQAQSALTAA